jgi:hypothetical protein
LVNAELIGGVSFPRAPARKKEKLMLEWAWRRLEPRIQALITDRIVTFHNALVERGQIAPPPVILPHADCSRAEYTRSYTEQGGLVPPQAAHSRHPSDASARERASPSSN